jgi:hypothetical protein
VAGYAALRRRVDEAADAVVSLDLSGASGNGAVP